MFLFLILNAVFQRVLLCEESSIEHWVEGMGLATNSTMTFVAMCVTNGILCGIVHTYDPLPLITGGSRARDG